MHLDLCTLAVIRAHLEQREGGALTLMVVDVLFDEAKQDCELVL